MDDFKREDNNAIICPYCSARDDDAWEHRDESGIITCWEDGCGKKFHWERCTSVEYRTKADCKLNNEEHNFRKPIHWIKDDKNPQEEFHICDCSKCSEYIVEKRIIPLNVDKKEVAIPPKDKSLGILANDL